ncbi:MAG TPA: FtsX-like permease family protein [Methylomirabilota bacterium]|nr:FtsX-like permease family protein [Methylomirabilota bacterium]
MSSWVARMAWRETRGAWRHWAYSLVCVALGVGALVGVGSVADSLARTVSRSAKSLMAGDVEIRSTQPLSAEASAAVAALSRERMAVTRVRELGAMARSGQGRTLLVELKAVEAGYPFYGRLVTDPDRPLAALIGGGRALVHESFLHRLGLAVGDRISLGDAELTISGVIRQEPDRSAGVFSLGPRVLIAAEDLDRTRLVQPGSRVRYRTLLRLPQGLAADAVRDALGERIPDPALRITTYTQAQPGLRRFWEQLSMYLGLAGLVALMVGGIGVALSVRAFVRQKLDTIAVLKCLGAAGRELLAAYGLQTVILGLAGSLAGAAVGSALPRLLGPFLAPLLPLEVEWVFSPVAVARGLAMGLGVTLLFALWPLLEIRRVPPALILRREVEPTFHGPRPWAAALPIVAGLAALSLWQSGSLKIGGLFVLGLGGALGLLWLGAGVVMALARRVRSRSLAWRQGTANLYRPGSHAGAVLVSLGLAVTLVVAVAILERSLREQISRRSPDTAPAFFFIDIQPDQVRAFRDLVAARTGSPPELTPVVRARLAALNGAPVAADVRTRRDDVWYLTREYALTWATEPPGHNTVIAGRWWTAEEARREPLISVEEEIAKNLGVGIGGTLTFDVLGVPVTARVTNLRRVDWQSLSSNFFVIFSPGALEGAPVTWLATASARPAQEPALQSAVVAAFPNVTAIPVREVLERVGSVLDQIALAIRLVAAVSVLAGVVVMAGALSVTRHQRLYHSVILKAVGATRGVVARIFAVEYGLLGAAAGLSGTALGAILAGAVLRFALDVRWSWAPAALAAGVLGATALALAVGLLGTRRLLGRPPLGVLRAE